MFFFFQNLVQGRHLFLQLCHSINGIALSLALGINLHLLKDLENAFSSMFYFGIYLWHKNLTLKHWLFYILPLVVPIIE